MIVRTFSRVWVGKSALKSTRCSRIWYTFLSFDYNYNRLNLANENIKTKMLTIEVRVFGWWISIIRESGTFVVGFAIRVRIVIQRVTRRWPVRRVRVHIMMMRSSLLGWSSRVKWRGRHRSISVGFVWHYLLFFMCQLVFNDWKDV